VIVGGATYIASTLIEHDMLEKIDRVSDNITGSNPPSPSLYDNDGTIFQSSTEIDNITQCIEELSIQSATPVEGDQDSVNNLSENTLDITNIDVSWNMVPDYSIILSYLEHLSNESKYILCIIVYIILAIYFYGLIKIKNKINNKGNEFIKTYMPDNKIINIILKIKNIINYYFSFILYAFVIFCIIMSLVVLGFYIYIYYM
jgi:hypothetical protein